MNEQEVKLKCLEMAYECVGPLKDEKKIFIIAAKFYAFVYYNLATELLDEIAKP